MADCLPECWYAGMEPQSPSRTWAPPGLYGERMAFAAPALRQLTPYIDLDVLDALNRKDDFDRIRQFSTSLVGTKSFLTLPWGNIYLAARLFTSYLIRLVAKDLDLLLQIRLARLVDAVAKLPRRRIGDPWRLPLRRNKD